MNAKYIDLHINLLILAPVCIWAALHRELNLGPLALRSQALLFSSHACVIRNYQAQLSWSTAVKQWVIRFRYISRRLMDFRHSRFPLQWYHHADSIEHNFQAQAAAGLIRAEQHQLRQRDESFLGRNESLSCDKVGLISLLPLFCFLSAHVHVPRCRYQFVDAIEPVVEIP
jgi:hypothetical protein